MKPALMRPGEAAAFLALSPTRFREIVNNGDITAVATGRTAKGDRFEEEELRQYICRKKVQRSSTCQSLKEVQSGGSISTLKTQKELGSLLDQLKKQTPTH